jgi:hypothetical protein
MGRRIALQAERAVELLDGRSHLLAGFRSLAVGARGLRREEAGGHSDRSELHAPSIEVNSVSGKRTPHINR